MWLHTQASVNIARQILKHPQLCPSFPHLILRLSLGLCLCFAFGFCFLWLLGKFIISIITIPITLTIKVVMVIILIIPIRKHHTSVNSITRLGSSRFAFSTSGFCDFGVCLEKKQRHCSHQCIRSTSHSLKPGKCRVILNILQLIRNEKYASHRYTVVFTCPQIYILYIYICTHMYIYILRCTIIHETS